MSLCLASSIFAIEAGGLILRSKQPRPVPTRRFLSLRVEVDDASARATRVRAQSIQAVGRFGRQRKPIKQLKHHNFNLALGASQART